MSPSSALIYGRRADRLHVMPPRGSLSTAIGGLLWQYSITKVRSNSHDTTSSAGAAH